MDLQTLNLYNKCQDSLLHRQSAETVVSVNVLYFNLR